MDVLSGESFWSLKSNVHLLIILNCYTVTKTSKQTFVFIITVKCDVFQRFLLVDIAKVYLQQKTYHTLFLEFRNSLYIKCYINGSRYSR